MFWCEGWGRCEFVTPFYPVDDVEISSQVTLGWQEKQCKLVCVQPTSSALQYSSQLVSDYTWLDWTSSIETVITAGPRDNTKFTGKLDEIRTRQRQHNTSPARCCVSEQSWHISWHFSANWLRVWPASVDRRGRREEGGVRVENSRWPFTFFKQKMTAEEATELRPSPVRPHWCVYLASLLSQSRSR